MAVRAFAARLTDARVSTLAAAAMLTLAGLGVATAVRANTLQAITLTLKDHRFSPSNVTVPAGQRVRVTLINQDPATEEFDSHDLRLEEVVTPMAKISFDIGPLAVGQYSFMGEFHADTAQGKVTAVAAGR